MNLKHKLYVLALFALFISPLLRAGGHAGNGGDVVVCRNPQNEITSIELLDYYEGKEFPPHVSPSLGDPSLTIDQKIDVVLQRLFRLDPLRAEHHRTQAKTFLEKVFFVRDRELIDIPDSNHLMYPKGCKVEQIAIAKGDGSVSQDFWDLWIPKGKQYIINEDLWLHPLFTNENKAGLILHEIIYGGVFKVLGTTSIGSRHFNAIISSDLLQEFTVKDYLSLLTKVKFKYAMNYQGLQGGLWRWTIDPAKCTFYDNGSLKQFHILNGFLVALPDRKMFYASNILLDENGRIKEAKSWYADAPSFIIDEELTKKVYDIDKALQPITFVSDDPYRLEYNLDQFLLFGEAFLNLLDTEKKILRERLKTVRIQQVGIREVRIGHVIIRTKETPSLELIKSDGENEYYLRIYFDNDSGEQEWVSKEQILKAFRKVIRGEK